MSGKVDAFGTISERFEQRHMPEPNSGCWLWLGALSAGKYGSLFYEGRMQKAHRVGWLLYRGEIPPGMEIDHLCRNTHCVNPAHLEPVTRSENLRRSPLMDRHSHRTHCIRGHEFTPENTMKRNKGKWRACRECQRMHTRIWRAERVG